MVVFQFFNLGAPMTKLLMPESTALWLLQNTGLTFHQIAQFCGLSILHVEALADGKTGHLSAVNPLLNGQLTGDEIEASTKNPDRPLVLQDPLSKYMKKKSQKPYVSLNKRHNRPHGILWLLRNYPDITDQQICQLLGTTRPTIASVRNKTHWDFAQIVPKHPVFLGLCSQEAFDRFVLSIEKRMASSSETKVGESSAGHLDISKEKNSIPSLDHNPV
jgi:hypothetical protein